MEPPCREGIDLSEYAVEGERKGQYPEGQRPDWVSGGDIVTIDAVKGLLNVHLNDVELAERRKRWSPPEPRFTTGSLGTGYGLIVQFAYR